jgi:hypothetical protein
MTREEELHLQVKSIANKSDPYQAYAELLDSFDNIPLNDKLKILEKLPPEEISLLDSVKEYAEEYLDEHAEESILETLDPADPDFYLNVFSPEYVGRYYEERTPHDADTAATVLSFMMGRNFDSILAEMTDREVEDLHAMCENELKRRDNADA